MQAACAARDRFPHFEPQREVTATEHWITRIGYCHLETLLLGFSEAAGTFFRPRIDRSGHGSSERRSRGDE